jgi:hypothetical protein
MRLRNLAMIVLLTFAIGFEARVFFEKSNTVYILNEGRFLTLTSLGLSSSEKSESNELTATEIESIKSSIKKLGGVLKSKYSDRPILIKKKEGRGFEIYSGTKQKDITGEITKEVIGEKRWKNIGEAFLK